MPAVVIAPYSAQWPVLFRQIADQLLPVFAPVAAVIEHIGSTAVPGLAAKPVIDVLLGAPALRDIESKIAVIESLGYTYVSKYERELPTRRYFVCSPAQSLRIHLHGVELGSPIWCNHLKFRDKLRADADLCARYQELKLQLAQQYADDKAAYTQAKDGFIREVLANVNWNA